MYFLHSPNLRPAHPFTSYPPGYEQPSQVQAALSTYELPPSTASSPPELHAAPQGAPCAPICELQYDLKPVLRAAKCEMRNAIRAASCGTSCIPVSSRASNVSMQHSVTTWEVAHNCMCIDVRTMLRTGGCWLFDHVRHLMRASVIVCPYCVGRKPLLLRSRVANVKKKVTWTQTSKKKGTWSPT